MFDISFSELTIASAVALIVLGPGEFRSLALYLRDIFLKARRAISSYTQAMNNEISAVKDHLIDLDGEIQPTYDTAESKENAQQKQKLKRQSADKIKNSKEQLNSIEALGKVSQRIYDDTAESKENEQQKQILQRQNADKIKDLKEYYSDLITSGKARQRIYDTAELKENEQRKQTLKRRSAVKKDL